MAPHRSLTNWSAAGPPAHGIWFRGAAWFNHLYAESSAKLIWQVSLLCCCREACELRGILARAAEALQQLEGAVRTLQRSGKEADAEGVQEAILQVGWPSQPAGSMTAWACMHGKSSHRERALPWVLLSSVGHDEATEMFRQRNAGPTSHQLRAQAVAQLSVSDMHVARAPHPLLQAELCGDLLTADVTQAQEALQRWRAASIAGAKLTAALQDGASIAVLSRAIQVRNRAGWSLSLHDAVILWLVVEQHTMPCICMQPCCCLRHALRHICGCRHARSPASLLIW